MGRRAGHFEREAYRGDRVGGSVRGGDAHKRPVVQSHLTVRGPGDQLFDRLATVDPEREYLAFTSPFCNALVLCVLAFAMASEDARQRLTTYERRRMGGGRRW